jgi:chromosomal replication initiation ATPase DnaA
MSLVEIGEIFHRDHTTVTAGLNHEDARGHEYRLLMSRLSSVMPDEIAMPAGPELELEAVG